jgi:cystathionine gamma-lyase
MTKILPDDLAHRLATRAVHAGQAPDPTSGAVMTPIYQTSTYVQEGLGRHKGYEYARTQNPTREALERNVASLEGARYGFAFGSGLAAADALLKLLSAGDHVVCGENVYGGTHRLMTQVYARLGLTFSFVDMRHANTVASAVTPATKMVFCETPTNPMMFLADLSAIGDLTVAHGLLFAVDNTFATPVFQQPLTHGADLVMHSTTKYLNGHSDVVGGALVTGRDDLAERFDFIVNSLGLGESPFDAWLVLRGVKTLGPRMEAHQRNAFAVARFLHDHPRVRRTYYPGLPDDPGHVLAAAQQSGFGGMVSFDLNIDELTPDLFFSRLRYFALAESLGGVESLVEQPWTMSHAGISEEARRAAGIGEGTIRLSVGIEHPDDLVEDLDHALRPA